VDKDAATRYGNLVYVRCGARAGRYLQSPPCHRSKSKKRRHVAGVRVF
jgi:hypothetical protein